MRRKISLGIVDDHELFRKGLALILNENVNFDVILQASNGLDLLDQLKKNVPDLLIMDLKMPEMNGIEATEKVRTLYPEIKIIILTMYNDEAMMVQLIEKGANGFLLKNEPIEIVSEAIESVMTSNYYFNDQVSKVMLQCLIKERKISPTYKKELLSEIEIKIIKLICMELTNKEIADKINLSSRTIDGYREKILSKTGAKNTAGIVIYAFKNNLIGNEI